MHVHICMQLHTCRTCGPFVFGQIFRNNFYFEQAEGQARRVKMSRGAKRRARHEKCTRSVTTEAKRGHEKHNRTLTPAHTCDRVKIVRAESAPRMRTPAVSSRARARIYMHPKGACIRTRRVRFNEPGSEADRALRKRKSNA